MVSWKERKKERMGEPSLRIAFLHPDLGIGGAERLVVDAAAELASMGHHVHIFTAHYDEKRCFEETKGLFKVSVYGDFLPRNIFYRLHALCAYIRCIYIALCMVLFWRLYDVIIVDQVSASIPVLKLLQSKIIFYCHFPDQLLAQHTTTLRRIYRKPIDYLEEHTTGLADCLLVNSQFTLSVFANTFTSLNTRGIHPQVLYPTVNANPFVIEGLENTIPQKKMFLSINRFERKKNIGLAISAFALLANHHKKLQDINEDDLQLVIVGGFDKRLKENQEYLDELKRMVEEKGIQKHVVFLPSCSTIDRNVLLATCLCVVYTPENEHFGIVPLEAMAAQKPVIACNSGGPKETIVNNSTGVLCDPTPQSFSCAMNILLQSPRIASEMGVAARQRVEAKFSRKVFGRTLMGIIHDVIKKDQTVAHEN